MFKTMLLSMAWLVFFEGETANTSIQSKIMDEGSRCSLPAPSNVHWVSAGTTFICFRWDPVPGAAYYRVKAFRLPANTMISSTLVTALPEMNGVCIADILPGTEVVIEVRSVCSNGMESPRLK